MVEKKLWLMSEFQPLLGILLMIVGIQLISTGLLADMIANVHHSEDETRISKKL